MSLSMSLSMCLSCESTDCFESYFSYFYAMLCIVFNKIAPNKVALLDLTMCCCVMFCGIPISVYVMPVDKASLLGEGEVTGV